MAGIVFLIMTTWKTGRRILRQRQEDLDVPMPEFLGELEERQPQRVPGTSVHMYTRAEGTPPSLAVNVEHNQVLHDRVLIVTVVTREIPYVRDEDRVEVRPLDHGLHRVLIYFGFAENPDVPSVLRRAKIAGEPVDVDETTFFLGRETLIATERPGMALWRERLFAFMSTNATRAARHFHIPSDRVLEVGTQVEL